jgi:alcohol dehydrogenase
MMAMIETGQIDPGQLVGEQITLEQSIDVLINMDRFQTTGATVINRF